MGEEVAAIRRQTEKTVEQVHRSYRHEIVLRSPNLPQVRRKTS
jgi:hypothetical protein